MLLAHHYFCVTDIIAIEFIFCSTDALLSSPTSWNGFHSNLSHQLHALPPPLFKQHNPKTYMLDKRSKYLSPRIITIIKHLKTKLFILSLSTLCKRLKTNLIPTYIVSLTGAP